MSCELKKGSVQYICSWKLAGCFIRTNYTDIAHHIYFQLLNTASPVKNPPQTVHRLLTPPAVTHNVCVKLEGERAIVDHDAAKAFPAELVSLIEEKGYCWSRSLTLMRPTCFGKNMPTRMFISQHESKAAGFKAAKDRVSLL